MIEKKKCKYCGDKFVTTETIKEYQVSKSLPADGIIGFRTVHAMRLDLFKEIEEEYGNTPRIPDFTKLEYHLYICKVKLREKRLKKLLNE